jgi:hypothetical protein
MIACTDIMLDPTQITNSRITLTPSTVGSPSDIRQNGTGWAVMSTASPMVGVNIANGALPGLIDMIQVSGNVQSFVLKYREILPSQGIAFAPSSDVDAQGYISYNGGLPVNCNTADCSVTFVNEATNHVGILAFDFIITNIVPVSAALPIDLKLDAWACIQA